MNPTTTRLTKEARTLFPFWCAVTIAGLAPFVRGQHWPRGPVEAIGFLDFFLGIPLLVTFTLGSEFLYGTFSSLLSQPVGRLRIWGEKMSVTILAVASAALVFGYAWRSELSQPVLWVGVLGIVAMIASATYWTLVARSMMGGLMLNLTALWVWGVLIGVIRPLKGEVISATWITIIAGLLYAGVMLWLGARKLMRFQVTGGMAGDDLMMAGPQFLPESLARLFRSQPSGALRNLVRKEFRLLQPVWLFTLLAVLAWLYLTIFGVVPERGSPEYGAAPPAVAIPMVLAGCLSLLIAILAGCLSLGEERTAGTHSWQLTLPVSARRQWLIKLVMALSTSLVGAVVLPVSVLSAVGFVRGTPFISPREPMVWMCTLLLLTLGSFWCACAVNGTWPAVAWLFPAMGAVLLAGECGNWAAQQLSQTTGTLREVAVSWLHLDPQAFLGIPAVVASVLLVIVPASLLAIIQSYRMFRTQPQDSVWGIARAALALALVVLFCSFSVSASGFGEGVLPVLTGFERWHPISETQQAVEKLQPDAAKLDAALPLQFTVEDLAKAAPLSALTERWLHDARITVAAGQAPLGHLQVHHATIIRLASGLECRIAVSYVPALGGKPIHRWLSCARTQP